MTTDKNLEVTIETTGADAATDALRSLHRGAAPHMSTHQMRLLCVLALLVILLGWCVVGLNARLCAVEDVLESLELRTRSTKASELLMPDSDFILHLDEGMVVESGSGTPDDPYRIRMAD